MATISDLMGGEDRRMISTGNSELDKKIADGLPLESLTLVEGENDTGKSVHHPTDHLGCHETGYVSRFLHDRKYQQEFYQADGINES